MTVRTPLVIVSGQIEQLQAADSIPNSALTSGYPLPQWGNQTIVSTADTRYLTPGYSTTNPSITSDYPVPVLRSGTLRNFVVSHGLANGNGNSVVYTVMKNGVATAMTVTLATGAVGIASDTVNTVTVTFGDLIAIQAVKASSIANGAISVTAAIELV